MGKCKMLIPLLIMALALGANGCANQIKSVSIDKETVTIEHGTKFVLTVSVMPNDVDDQSVAWSVDTQNVSATTNENTLQKEFLAANVGEANIRVISSNGLRAVCIVTVTENAADKLAREKTEEEARIAAEKKAEEDKIAQETAEAEAKKGYATGITYNQIARTPDDYEGKKVKFYGQVLQVIEGDGETNLRVATKATSYGSYYEDIVLVYYNPKIMDSRVLEDDMITLYGVSKGLYTYESTLGGNITVPLIAVDKIEIK